MADSHLKNEEQGMNEDIIRMAQEAQQERLSLDGRSVPSTALSGYWFSMEVADLARFAALVRADERERIKAEPVAGVVLNEEGRAALAMQRLTDAQQEMERSIESLKAALAQQAEPVATITECEACFTPDVCQLRGTCDYYTASQMRIAAPQQQAEPVEPVAWVGDPSTQDYASTVPDLQITDRLARHGIPMPEGDNDGR